MQVLVRSRCEENSLTNTEKGALISLKISFTEYSSYQELMKLHAYCTNM
jgi:hypothetical protein